MVISALISETVVSLCGSAPLTGDLVPAMKGCVNFHFYILASKFTLFEYLSKHTILTSFYFKTIFLVKSKLSKPQHFYEFFIRFFFRQISHEIKVVNPPTFFRVFYPVFFFRQFSREIKVVNAPTFFRVFHPIFSTIFS